MVIVYHFCLFLFSLFSICSAITISPEEVRKLCNDVRRKEYGDLIRNISEDIVGKVAGQMENSKLFRSGGEKMNSMDKLLYRTLVSEFVENPSIFRQSSVIGSGYDSLFQPNTIDVAYKIKNKKNSLTDVINVFTQQAGTVSTNNNVLRVQSQNIAKTSSLGDIYTGVISNANAGASTTRSGVGRKQKGKVIIKKRSADESINAAEDDHHHPSEHRQVPSHPEMCDELVITSEMDTNKPKNFWKIMDSIREQMVKK